jgi:hypothetical protein
MRVHLLVSLIVGVAMLLSFNASSVVGDEPARALRFELSKADAQKAEKLAQQLAALSPRVNPEEAKLLAACAFATVGKLRPEYRMFGTPIFNNFLVYHGIRKRGYCYHWAEDLLVALDKLKLRTLELRWGEAHAGTWRENNCIVVTAKGQPFSQGIMLECWRHMGHLFFGPVAAAATDNFDPYTENPAYARFVRQKAAAAQPSPRGHHVAIPTSRMAKRKKAAGGSADAGSHYE